MVISFFFFSIWDSQIIAEEKVVEWMFGIAERGAQMTRACGFVVVSQSLGAAVQTWGDGWQVLQGKGIEGGWTKDGGIKKQIKKPQLLVIQINYEVFLHRVLPFPPLKHSSHMTHLIFI